MANFKIFDELNMAVKEPITGDEILMSEHRATINVLPMEHREIIWALIYHYYVSNPAHHTGGPVPYKGKIGIGGKGVHFDVNCLPRRLQAILVEYLKRLN